MSLNKKRTRTVGMTHCDILLLPLRISARGEDDGVPGEMPRQYNLCGCNFVFFGEGYDQWVVADGGISCTFRGINAFE